MAVVTRRKSRTGKQNTVDVFAQARSTRTSSKSVAGDLLHATPKRQARPWRRWSCLYYHPGDRHEDVEITTSTYYQYKYNVSVPYGGAGDVDKGKEYGDTEDGSKSKSASHVDAV